MAKDNRHSWVDERYARLKQLFFGAVELDGDDRRRFVNEACGEDAELRADLESLLDCHRRSDMPEDFQSRRQPS